MLQSCGKLYLRNSQYLLTIENNNYSFNMCFKTKGVCLLHTNTIAGVAHQTSEKQKPGPLDLTLLFREVVEVKKGGGNGASTREILFSSIAEYNKSCSNKV